MGALERLRIAATTIALAALVGTAAALIPWQATVSLILAVTVCASLVLAPLHLLPGLAVVAYAFIPTNYLPGNTIANSISPGLLVLTLWTARCMWVRHEESSAISSPSAILLLLLGAWLVLGVIRSIDTRTSIIYAVMLLLFLGAPVLLRSCGDELTLDALRRSWLATATVLATAAIVERVLQTNPLTDFYRLGPDRALEQVWSVYRVTTTLGHPLANAFFFSATVGLCLGMCARRVSIFPLLTLGMSAIALLLTASRTGLLAAGVSALVVISILTMSRGASTLVRVGVPMAAATIGTMLYLSPLVQERLTSSEARESGADRAVAWHVASRTAEAFGYMGSGPGTSNEAVIAVAPTRYILESTIYQLLVSIGLPGLMVLGALLTLICVTAAKERRLDALGALVAALVCSLGFNMAESYRPGWTVISLAVLLALGGATNQSKSLRAERSSWVELRPGGP